MSFEADPHTLDFTDGQAVVQSSAELVKIDTVEFGFAIYRHDPLDGSKPYFVIDIDNDRDDAQPIKIYRNDALVYDEQGAPILQEHL